MGSSAAGVPSQALEALTNKRNRIANELDALETQIYNKETEYLVHAEHTAFGSVLKGFEGFLTSKSAAGRNKTRTFRMEDRSFSLSSYTSPATRELKQSQGIFDNGPSIGNYTYGGKG